MARNASWFSPIFEAFSMHENKQRFAVQESLSLQFYFRFPRYCITGVHYIFSNQSYSNKDMGVRRNFYRGSKIDILLILFRLLTMQCKWTFTKRFTLRTPQIMRFFRQQSQKRLFIGRSASFLLILPFTQCKATRLAAISSHCLAALPVKIVNSTVTCGKAPATVTWSEPLKICCNVIVTQQRPKVEQSARKFHNLLLQAVCRQRSRFSELQAHHCMTPERWTLVRFECNTGK